jgi:sugar lactone lactonase YvrE
VVDLREKTIGIPEGFPMTNKIVLSRIFLAAISAGAWLPLAGNAAPGDLWVSCTAQTILKYSPDGTQTIVPTQVSAQGLTFDAKGNLFTAEDVLNRISKYPPGNPTGSVFASGLNMPYCVAFDGAGTLYETDNGSGNIFQFTPAGVKTTFSGGLNEPTGVAVGPDGRVYVSESGGASGIGTVYRYSQGPGGTKIRTVFASGMSSPQAIVFDAAGNLFVADFHGEIYKVAPDGTKTTFASGIGAAVGLAFNASGNLFVSQLIDNGPIFQFTPTGGKSTFATQTNNRRPRFLAFEPTLHSLLNVSTRAFVHTGDSALIAGFIVGGNGAVNGTVVARAIGPSLANFGVPSTLQDPTLELHNAAGAIVATNDNWKENPSQQALIQGVNLGPADDRESAIFTILASGNYTAVVRGVGNTEGNALVEVYNIP